jgi:uncharacterized protein YbaP (TraB family)
VGRIGRLVGFALALCGPFGSAKPDPAAWQVSDSRGGQLWLLGSVHYLRAEDHPLPALIDRLYESATALVMELDLDDLDPAATQASLLAAAALPADGSLESALGAELWQILAQRATELGLPMEALSRIEPWLVALTLLDAGLLRAGYGAQFGLEQTLLRRAEQDGLPVLGLETVEQQIGIFDRLNMPMQRELLAQTLAELDTGPATIANLVSAWRSGDLAALEAALSGEMELKPELFEALVAARNRHWVSELKRLLAADQSYLVIVGALHLVGANSVVALMESEGYRIERLPDASR